MSKDIKPDLVTCNGVPLTPSQIMMIEDGLPLALLRALNPDVNQPKEPDMAKPGPKELQIAALPHLYSTTKKTKPVPDTGTPPQEAAETVWSLPPLPKEKTAMKTGTGKQKTKKGGPKKASKKVPPKAKAPRPAAQSKEGGVRPGSKLEAIGALLMSDKGATASEICAIAGWERVSVPPIIARLGKTMKKSSEDGSTRYFAV